MIALYYYLELLTLKKKIIFSLKIFSFIRRIHAIRQ